MDHSRVTGRTGMRQRAATWLLVLALLAAQTLGLLHRAVHPGGALVGEFEGLVEVEGV